MKTTQQDVHARAILVALRISSWSAKKHDVSISREVAESHGASPLAGRYHKNLLPGSNYEVPVTAPPPLFAAAGSMKRQRMTKAQRAAVKIAKAEAKEQAKKAAQQEKELKANSHEKLAAHIAAIRVWVNEQTLPWTDDGWRILPIANYDRFMAGWRERLHKAEELLDEFVRDYPALRELAKQVLNGMWNAADYPSDIRSRYRFDIVPRAVPSGSDYRVELSDAEVEAISKRTEQDVREAFQAATDDAVKRVFTVLSRIHERLTGADPNRKTGNKTFRDTLITNARELCDVLTRLNVTGDSRLEHFRRETELLAAATEPETLRDDAAVRAETANRAQGILDAMTATFGAAMFQKK